MPKVSSDFRPKLAVWKFSSCDGCQLTVLDCEDELLELADKFEIAYFLEASRKYSIKYSHTDKIFTFKINIGYFFENR